MLATMAVGPLVCAYNGNVWSCEDERLENQLNEFTRQYKENELEPASGDPLLAVAYAALDFFGGIMITFPPPEPSPGQGTEE